MLTRLGRDVAPPAKFFLSNNANLEKQKFKTECTSYFGFNLMPPNGKLKETTKALQTLLNSNPKKNQSSFFFISRFSLRRIQDAGEYIFDTCDEHQ